MGSAVGKPIYKPKIDFHDSFKFLSQVGSIFCCSGWVSHLWLFRFGHGKFPLKIPNFTIFPLWVKKNCFGLGQRWAGLLFTADQKYARVRSGPFTTFNPVMHTTSNSTYIQYRKRANCTFFHKADIIILALN